MKIVTYQLGNLREKRRRRGGGEWLTKILTKPLPQILDEMEANIVAAAEAARKAEVK